MGILSGHHDNLWLLQKSKKPAFAVFFQFLFFYSGFSFDADNLAEGNRKIQYFDSIVCWVIEQN